MGQDECAGAIPLTAGTSTAFDTSGATTSFPVWACALVENDLWFSYTSMTTGGSQITVETCGSSYDTALEIFSGSCAAAAHESCNDDACAFQSTATASAPAAGTQFFIRVGGYNGATGPGTIVVNEGPDPCAADVFEPNADCASAVPLGDGVCPGLNVRDGDNDYYAVGVDPGATLTVDIFFLHSTADTDLYLWDPLLACDTNVAGSGALAVGYSTTDDEQVVYTNTTGTAQNLIVEVDMYSSGGCNAYDLQISGSNGMGGSMGTNYCDANDASTGVPGSMRAAGSRVVGNNDVTLTAADLPTNSFAFFLTSTTQGFIPNPGGSQGNLCVGGAIGRYVGPGQIQQSGAAGEVSLALDLTAIPQPNGFAAAMPGDTWNFTLWFRDANPGPTSNFTDGISIVFL
ncbi:MAG: hypothetical protein AAGB93_04120 [Planctomycetota bacterium]